MSSIWDITGSVLSTVTTLPVSVLVFPATSVTVTFTFVNSVVFGVNVIFVSLFGTHDPSPFVSITSPPKLNSVALPFVVKPVPLTTVATDPLTYLVPMEVTVGLTRSIVKLTPAVTSFRATSTILIAPSAISVPVAPIVSVIRASAYVAVTPSSVNDLSPIVTTGLPATLAKLNSLAPLPLVSSTLLKFVSALPTVILTPAAFLTEATVGAVLSMAIFALFWLELAFPDASVTVRKPYATLPVVAVTVIPVLLSTL